MMDSGYLQGKEYASLKGKSLYLILGGSVSYLPQVYSPPNAQYLLGPTISQVLQHCCEMGNKPIYIL